MLYQDSLKSANIKEALTESSRTWLHNMFGAGSLGAAVAIKELIAAGKLKGTIRFTALLPKKT
jgi:aminobenzoyl-glutamate utilization protein B